MKGTGQRCPVPFMAMGSTSRVRPAHLMAMGSTGRVRPVHLMAMMGIRRARPVQYTPNCDVDGRDIGVENIPLPPPPPSRPC